MVELVIGRLNHRGKSQGVTSDDTRMGKSEVRLLCGFCVCRNIYLCVRTYHVCNNYVTYIVAMRPYFS